MKKPINIKLEEALNRLYKENKISIDAFSELIEFADPEKALQLRQVDAIPRSIPDKLYILIQEKKDKRYFMFENIEGQANYSHGQCDTIEVIEDWLSKL